MSRRALLLLFLTLLVAVPVRSAQAAGTDPREYPAGCKPMAIGKESKRKALLIGNQSYRKLSPLSTPISDTKDLGNHLITMGFEVERCEELDAYLILQAADVFAERVLNAKEQTEVALFYFAGHGAQDAVYGVEYGVVTKVPVALATILSTFNPDAMKQDDGEPNRAVKPPLASIFVFDSCRVPRGRPLEKPAPVKPVDGVSAPVGSYVVYSTAPGMEAQDAGTAADPHSPFAREFLAQLKTRPTAEVDDIFRTVRLKVKESSQGYQIPWTSHSLLGPVHFKEPA